MAHELAAKPVSVKGVTNDLAMKLYHRAQKLDEWDGEDYDGSSVLAAVKAAKELGYYDEYRWAFGVDDLALAVSRHGPAVIGINWHETMMTPDDRGYIRPAGQVVGGHAILCVGYNCKTLTFRLHNSWGKGWGKDGDCFIGAASMDVLLHRQGEACILVNRKKG